MKRGKSPKRSAKPPTNTPRGQGKATGRKGPQARKSGAPKASGIGSRKPIPTKLTSRKHQQASAEILRAIADASGDIARPLQQIAETTARLFSAPSVSRSSSPRPVSSPGSTALGLSLKVGGRVTAWRG
jgi:two-component system, NtrC family, sensor kinase